jgi:hypothetical protein
MLLLTIVATGFIQTPSPAVVTTGRKSVQIKVVDQNGSDLSGVKVALFQLKYLPRRGTHNAASHRQRPIPEARGKTDASGSVSLFNVAKGEYIAVARLKGTGFGHTRASVNGSDLTVTITLKPKTSRLGGGLHNRPVKAVS